MNCEQIRREELAEKYLAGRMSESEQEGFERHYFECKRCFEEVQTLRSLQVQLERLGATPEITPIRAFPWSRWAWAPALAIVLFVVGMAVWLRRPTQPLPVASRPGVERQSAPASVQQPILAELTQVQPPPYRAAVLRGAADPATRRFRKAMEAYEKQQYAAAIPGLRKAAQLNPTAPDARFFLGICYLLDEHPKEAIEELERTVALGETPFLEAAHFYLAKAHLRENNLSGAKTEMEKTIQLRGDREAEARRLLGLLEMISRNRP
jgi:tetratricopeptide (TPR) repeat protein